MWVILSNKIILLVTTMLSIVVLEEGRRGREGGISVYVICNGLIRLKLTWAKE